MRNFRKSKLESYAKFHSPLWESRGTSQKIIFFKKCLIISVTRVSDSNSSLSDSYTSMKDESDKLEFESETLANYAPPNNSSPSTFISVTLWSIKRKKPKFKIL